MSSPYGQIDPNRIALNRQAREAQARFEAQRQAEIAAQQQRQREIDAQRKAAEDAARAKSTVTSRRITVDDSGPVDTTPSDFEIFKAFEAANPDANLNSLNITRDSSGKIKSINGNLFDAKLYSDLANTGRLTDEKQGLIPIYGKVEEQPERAVTPGGSFQDTQTISFTAGLAPLQEQLINEAKNAPKGPSTSPEAVNLLRQSAKEQGYNLQGYYVSKDANGRITEYGGTFGDPLVGSTPYYREQIARSRPVNRDLENLNYSIFKENQIIKAQNAGAPSAYRLTSGDISNLRGAGYDNVLTFARQEGQPDFGFASPVQGKPFSFEQVGPYGQIIRSSAAPRNNQNNIAYNVNIPESISITDKATALPSSPVEGFKQSAQNFIDQNLLGAFGTGIGIGSIFTGLAGQPLSPYTKQLIETKGEQVNNAERPELLGGVINAGIQQAGGKSDAFSGFVNTLETAPLFFVGSAGFTALTFASPGGAVKGVRLAARGLGTVARETPHAASELTKVVESALPYGPRLEQASQNVGRAVGDVIGATVSKVRTPLNVGFTELRYGLSDLGKNVNERLPSMNPYTAFDVANKIDRTIQPVAKPVAAFSVYTGRGAVRTGQDVKSLFAETVEDFGNLKKDVVSDFTTHVSTPIKGQLQAEYNEALRIGNFLGGPIKEQLGTEYDEALAMGRFYGPPIKRGLQAGYGAAEGLGKFLGEQGKIQLQGEYNEAKGLRRLIGGPIKGQLAAEYDEAKGLGKFLGGPLERPVRAYGTMYKINKFNIEQIRNTKSAPRSVFSRGFFADGETAPSNVQPKTSFSPLENVGLQLVDNGLKETGRTNTNRVANAGLEKFIGVSYGSSRGSTSRSSENVFLRYPEGTTIKQPTRSIEREGVIDMIKLGSGAAFEPVLNSNSSRLLASGETSRLGNKSEERPMFSPLSLFNLEPRKGTAQAPESIVSPLLTPAEDTSVTPLQATGEDIIPITTPASEQTTTRDDSELFFFGGYDEDRGKRKRKGRRKGYSELTFRPNYSLFAGTAFEKSFRVFPIE